MKLLVLQLHLYLCGLALLPTPAYTAIFSSAWLNALLVKKAAQSSQVEEEAPVVTSSIKPIISSEHRLYTASVAIKDSESQLFPVGCGAFLNIYEYTFRKQFMLATLNDHLYANAETIIVCFGEATVWRTDPNAMCVSVAKSNTQVHRDFLIITLEQRHLTLPHTYRIAPLDVWISDSVVPHNGYILGHCKDHQYNIVRDDDNGDLRAMSAKDHNRPMTDVELVKGLVLMGRVEDAEVEQYLVAGFFYAVDEDGTLKFKALDLLKL